MITMLVALLLCVFVSVVLPSRAHADHSENHRIMLVKAAVVLNVARFVSWPDYAFADPYSPLNLCYFRTNPFPDALHSIEGKPVSGRKLVIRKVDNMPDARECQIMLVALAEMEHYNKVRSSITRSARAPAMLTLADRTDDTSSDRHDDSRDNGIRDHDIMVSLIRAGSRIGFEVNLRASKEAGLKISSELLKHARIVRESKL
jgi:hypothetical protein